MRKDYRIFLTIAFIIFSMSSCSRFEAPQKPEQPAAVAVLPPAPAPAPLAQEVNAPPVSKPVALPRVPREAPVKPSPSDVEVPVAREIPAPAPETLPMTQVAGKEIAPEPANVVPVTVPVPSNEPQQARAPTMRRVTLPEGTRVTVRTVDSIDSRSDQVGQTFLASVDSDIIIDGQIVVPGKSEAYLRLTQANSAGELRGKSELQLQLQSIAAGGKSYTVESTTIERSGEPEGQNTARDVTIGAAIGAAIGAITGGGKGAAVGATAEAGAGVAIAASTKGEQVLVRSETRLDFLLERAVEVELPFVPPAAPPVSSRNDASGAGPRRLGEGPVPVPRDGDDKEVGLSGSWDLTILGPQGRRALDLYLTQRGRTLTGRIEDWARGGSVPVHGTVDGDSISFTTVVRVYGRTVEEHFTGTIVGNRMQGTLMIDTTFISDRRGGRRPATHQRATWTARKAG